MKLSIYLALFSVILTTAFFSSCFDSPANEPICFDRRVKLIQEAQKIKLLVNNKEFQDEDSLRPLYSNQEKIEAILDFETSSFKELIEERYLSCGLTEEFTETCRNFYPILFNDAFTEFDPSYYRAPWLYLIGELQVSETVTACDLILNDELNCLSTTECAAEERCIALSTSIPELDALQQSLGNQIFSEIVSSYCGLEQDSCTRCLSKCRRHEDCSSSTERCIVPQQASHGICLPYKSNN